MPSGRPVYQYLLAAFENICVFVSISAFALLFDVPVRIASSAVGLKICKITAGIKKYNLIIKKKRKKHEKVVSLGKTKLNTIEVVVPKALRDLYINHDEFASVNNMLREYNKMKDEMKSPENDVEYAI